MEQTALADLQETILLWDRVFLDTELGVERLPMR
jgi:hypothetical protein